MGVPNQKKKYFFQKLLLKNSKLPPNVLSKYAFHYNFMVIKFGHIL